MQAESWIEKVLQNDVQGVVAALAADRSLAAARDPYLGSTALHYAAHRGFGDVVAALLAAGADVHAREEASDTTALHWAAEGGHVAVARMLIDGGADVEAVDGWYGLSPLGWATFVTWEPGFHEDKQGVASYLLAAGARHDAFTVIATGSAEALHAVAAADPRAVHRRLRFVGETKAPLHVAVERRRGDMVDALIELGADLHARTTFGMTPLAIAVLIGDGPTARRLRDAGAREDLATALVAGDLAALARELSAAGAAAKATLLLFAAARHGFGDQVTLLVRHGANVDARLRQLVAEKPALVGPLHLAAQHGHTDAVRAILDAGATVSLGRDEGAPTPLHLAADGGHADVVELLVARGADVAACDRGFGATAMVWAEQAGHVGVAQWLRSVAEV